MSRVKFVLLMVVSLLIYSCGQKGWSEQEKKDFIKGCVKSNKGRISEEASKEGCECMLNKIMKKYPTMIASQEMSKEEIKKLAASCWGNIIKNNANKIYILHKTKDGKVGFMLDTGWKKPEQTNFDLQRVSENAFMGVFVDNIRDFKEGTTKKDVLKIYIKDIMSRRKKVKKESVLKEIKDNGLIIYQTDYTADIDTNRNFYCFNIIDFGKDEDTFAFVLFITLPSYAKDNIQNLNAILKTAKILDKN